MTPELVRLILAQVFLHAAMAGTRMTAPLLALSEGDSPAAVGGLLALFALAQVFLALPAGRFADRHGLRRPLSYAVVAAVIGAGSAAAFPIYPVLCLAALLTGGATGTAVIALQRHVGRAADSATQLKQVFSWLGIAPAVANFVGPFAAGLLIDHAGYRTAFAVMACLPLVCWYMARRTRELPPVVVAPQTGKGPKPRVWDLLRVVMFRRLLFVNWLQSSCWDVHTFVLPLIGHERGFSASTIGTILGVFAVAAAVVRLVLPLVAARVREWAVIATSSIVTAVLFAAYPLLPSAFAMGVCSVLLGFSLGAVQPMVMSMLHQVTPHARHGEALGLRLMTINASSVVMPVLFGAAGAVVGISGVFWIVGLVIGGGSRAAWSLRDGLPTAQQQDHSR